MTISGLQSNLGVSNEDLGVSNENIIVFNENLGVSYKNMGVSNENMGVSNENLGVSNETFMGVSNNTPMLIILPRLSSHAHIDENFSNYVLN